MKLLVICEFSHLYTEFIFGLIIINVKLEMSLVVPGYNTRLQTAPCVLFTIGLGTKYHKVAVLGNGSCIFFRKYWIVCVAEKHFRLSLNFINAKLFRLYDIIYQLMSFVCRA